MFKLIAFFMVLIGGGFVLYQWQQQRARADAVPKPPETAKVFRAPVTLSVAATGRVVANLDVEIKCKASGQIMKLPFEISDPVKKGDTLVEIDPVDESRAVKQAEVALAAADARLAQAKRNLLIAERNIETNMARAKAMLEAKKSMAHYLREKAHRTKELVAKKFSSSDEFEAVDANATQAEMEAKSANIKFEEMKTEEAALELRVQDVKLAEAEVASDTIALSNANQRLKDCTILAPIDGVVAARTVQVGQIISSGISNVGGGTAVLTLSDLSRIFLLASVDESDIGIVSVGLTVKVTTDAFADRTFEGKVVRVATRGVNSSNVVTFEVKIEILGGDKHLLKSEMTANVEIIAQEKKDALVLPVEAVTRKKGKRFVEFVKADGAIEERAVEVGIGDGVNLEIISGLNEGDEIAVRSAGAESKFRKDDTKKPQNPFTKKK